MSTIPQPGRVALITQGCKVNQYETQLLREGFLARGWELRPFGEETELTVINSCTVTAGSDRDLRKLVARARRVSPSGRIVVTGCRAEVDPVGSARLEGVDWVLGNTRKGELPALLSGEGPAREAGEPQALASSPERAFPRTLSDPPVSGLGERARPILKIQDGCNLRCSFCIVPAARGDSRSRPAAEVLAHARHLESLGFREVVLSGIQLGFYRDAALDLAALLDLLLAGTQDLRFRLGSLLPRHITPALRRVLGQAGARLCPHLHLSLQSGDDAVLRAMKRPYRREQLRELLLSLEEELSDPCLGTDLIVGFPGEDAASFNRSEAFVKALPLAYGHVFPFSPRTGTAAARLMDPVSHADKAYRSKRMRAILKVKGEEYRRRQRGRRLLCIAEEREAEGQWLGTSENYQRVRFAARDLQPGSLHRVEIAGVAGDRLEGRRIAEQSCERAQALGGEGIVSRKFYVETYGCQMNSYDSQVIVGVLEAQGLEQVAEPGQSDLIILNTCSVRENAEVRVIGRINQLAGLRLGREKRLLMGVAGCMAQRLGPKLIGDTKRRVDFVVGPDQYKKLPAILAAVDADTDKEEAHYFTDFDHLVTYQAKPKQSPPGGTHFVAVMHGCDKYCSYCIVPFTRGRERSKDWGEVVDEVQLLADRGAFEVTLLGQTISSYRHGDVDFAGLLEKVSAVAGIQSVRFLTSYPTDMNAALFRRIAALPEASRGIHLPVQSGSDEILRRMNRRYTVAEYEAILATGRRELPDALFSTDIIVGFPGETETDFQATLDLVERQGFSSAFTFKYSPREGTVAHRRSEDDVPQPVKEERLARLMALQERKGRERLQEQLGRELEILLDETSKKDETRLRGRTRSNLRVIVDRRPGLEIGRRVKVRPQAIAGSSLIAELL